jgi:uncharacterized cupin superfamily protein
MGYHVLDTAGLSSPDHPCERRSITDAAGLANLVVALYRVAPGEQLARTYHYHEQREEVFHVLEGVLHVETPDGDFRVPAESAFVAEPESPHRAFNPDQAEESVRVIGVGAPRSDPGLPYEGDRDEREA